MESSSTFVQDDQTKAFVEPECTIEFQGRKFTSGGAWLMQNAKTGKLQGIMYANPQTHTVSTWSGNIKVNALFGRVFQSNWYNVRRQYCWFEYAGHSFIGINYSVDNQDCISVREISKN